MLSPAKLLIFWDYDTQWGADRSRSAGGPKNWGPLEFENTERLLDLHAQYNMPACFAVVGAAALHGERPYHDPQQIRRIHQAGHEVASHSFRHEWLPSLDRQALTETLKQSKNALEQCIGAAVVSFVPPYNQPFDYPAAWAFSLSERRAVRNGRTDLKQLCEVLAECGYRFSRISYLPLFKQLQERLLGWCVDRPVQLEQISGVTCIRLNTPGGFDEPAKRVLYQCVAQGGWVVVYGHPHSSFSGNSQDVTHFVSFLELVTQLRREGKLSVCLPRDIVDAR